MRIYSVLIFFILLVLSIWDFKWQVLPRKVIAAGFLISGVRVLFFVVAEGPWTERVYLVCEALFGALPGFALFVMSLYSEKIGRGDGLVIMITGLGENYLFSMLLLGMACILMALPGAALLVIGRVHKNTRMPFVPFITISYLILELLSFFKLGGTYI